jgi:hypothetical protein
MSAIPSRSVISARAQPNFAHSEAVNLLLFANVIRAR